MLLMGSHLRALEALKARDATGQVTRGVEKDDQDAYRVLELQGFAEAAAAGGIGLTDAGREALRLLEEMHEQRLLPPAEQIEPTWRFLGSEILAALVAAGRAGGRVGPLAQDLLATRGLAQMLHDPDTKVRSSRLNTFGTRWLELALRFRPHLEIRGDLANTIHEMSPAYVEPHRLGIPGEHALQLEAMRLLIWSVPDRDVFTLTAVGMAVYEALRKGGFPVEETVLDDALLMRLTDLAHRGAHALPQEQLMELQMLGYAGADGSLTPSGVAALHARRLCDAEPSRCLATIAINQHEVELLEVMESLSEGPKEPAQAPTKQVLHKELVDRLDKRFQAFEGRYGRIIQEVTARKRQAQRMVAELRDRDRAFGDLDALDERLVHLESFELVRAEGEGKATVYQLTHFGRQVVQEQGHRPRAITGTAVKAITLTTQTGLYLAPAAAWIERARAEGLIGTGGITQAGRFYAWLAANVRRYPALTQLEARLLLNLPETEQTQQVQEQRGDGRKDSKDGDTGKDEDEREDEDEQTYTLDRLEARGLIERLVDGQIVRTESGQLLERAVAGALELACPLTPAIVRLLSAVRQVGESLYVKEPKVRIPPRQWEEVERLTGLGPEAFQETVHLAKLGKYLGEANLTEAGRDVLEAFTRMNRGEG